MMPAASHAKPRAPLAQVSALRLSTPAVIWLASRSTMAAGETDTTGLVRPTG